MPLLLFKAYVNAHTRRLKNGQVVHIAAYYDKRIKKSSQHAPDHTHDVSHLSDEDKAKFGNMHKEQHVAHFYEAHALGRKLDTEKQLLATLERSSRRYEEAGDKKSVTAVHNKVIKLNQSIMRHERMHSRAKAIVEGIGQMKEGVVKGSGKLIDDADKAHAHYAGKLEERFVAENQQSVFKPDYSKKVPLLILTDDTDMPIGGSAKELGKYLMEKYRNLSVTNKDTHLSIGIYRNGIESSLKNRKPTARRLYAILPQLLEHAVLTGVDKNTKADKKPGVLAYETFHAPVSIDGKYIQQRLLLM
jgi:hypothetical protein